MGWPDMNENSVMILGTRGLKALLILVIWTQAVGGIPEADCPPIRKALRDLRHYGLAEEVHDWGGPKWRATPRGSSYLEDNVP